MNFRIPHFFPTLAGILWTKNMDAIGIRLDAVDGERDESPIYVLRRVAIQMASSAASAMPKLAQTRAS